MNFLLGEISSTVTSGNISRCVKAYIQGWKQDLEVHKIMGGGGSGVQKKGAGVRVECDVFPLFMKSGSKYTCFKTSGNHEHIIRFL